MATAAGGRLVAAAARLLPGSAGVVAGCRAAAAAAAAGSSSWRAASTLGRAAAVAAASATHGRGSVGVRRAAPSRSFTDNTPLDAPVVEFCFVDKDGKELPVKGRVGQNLVVVAHANGVDLEGACECSLACSTCHVILASPIYESLPGATDEEEDLLDLAFGLTATSRLGCQVLVTPAFQGTKIQLPAATRNFYVDGHKPKPH